MDKKNLPAVLREEGFVSWAGAARGATLQTDDRERKGREQRCLFDFAIVQDRVVRKMALAAEMEAVSKWPQLIAAESDAESKGMLPRLEGIIKKGRDALDSRVKAETDNAIFRSREFYAFVDKVNATRVTTYAELLSRAVKLGLDKSFASSFFRHDTADTRRPAQEAAETPRT